MQQLVLTYSYGSFSFYNLHLIHYLPKVGLHDLYMKISVLFANLYSSREKGFEEIHRMKNKLFIFNFVFNFDILFFCSCRKTNYFFKKNSRPPPPNIKWSVANDTSTSGIYFSINLQRLLLNLSENTYYTNNYLLLLQKLFPWEA